MKASINGWFCARALSLALAAVCASAAPWAAEPGDAPVPGTGTEPVNAEPTHTEPANAQPANARPSGPAVYGVWRGTLGRHAVMVRLGPDGCDSSYYYLRHLWGIGLAEQSEPSGAWKEQTGKEQTGATAATWRFEAATATTLEGTWTDPQGKQVLPLRLRKVAVPRDASQYCGGSGMSSQKDFNAPRIAANKPSVADAQFAGRTYQNMMPPRGEINAVKVPGQPRLNRLMEAWLESKVVDYYDCQLMLRERFGAADPASIDFQAEWAPVYWGDRWLALAERYSNDCGGMHPNSGLAGYLVWDVAADKAIDPWGWIRASQGEYGSHMPPEKLNRLIYRLAAKQGIDDECVGVVKDNATYSIHPNATGMVFSTAFPRALLACTYEVVVPYDKLRPFMTRAGVAAVDALKGGTGKP